MDWISEAAGFPHYPSRDVTPPRGGTDWALSLVWEIRSECRSRFQNVKAVTKERTTEVAGFDQGDAARTA